MEDTLQEELQQFVDPYGLVNLPKDSERVEDAEEEVLTSFTMNSSQVNKYTRLKLVF